MTSQDFKNASKKPFDLGDDGRAQIDHALSRYLHMDEADRVQLIDDIERTGQFRVFGYGSLIGDSASDNDNEYGGSLAGWEKGAFCKDRHYRGTPENLGVTMGALPTEDAKGSLPGVIQQIDATRQSGDFSGRILEHIKDFARRETSANPIYEYKVVEVETTKNGAVKALICAADEKNPLYLGRDGEQLTLHEKAAIIATSIGAPGASPRNTGMAYWRDHIKCCDLGGFEPDESIKELVQLAEVYRAQLEHDDPELFAKLTDNEKQAGPAGAALGVTYATPVYDVSTISIPENAPRVLELRGQAIDDADLYNDPLTPERVEQIQDFMIELGIS